MQILGTYDYVHQNDFDSSVLLDLYHLPSAIEYNHDVHGDDNTIVDHSTW